MSMTKHELLFDDRKYDIADLPDMIFIESYKGCNLRCRMCPVPDFSNTMNGRKFTSMSMNTYEKIIEQISERPRSIWLNQMGEPLLNKNLTEFIKLARDRGHYVAFTTNGTLMTPEVATAVITAGLDKVVFSFDGCRKETYESIRVGASYEAVVLLIKNFAETNRRLGGKCAVQIDCIVSDLTCSEVEGVKAMWEETADHIGFIPLDNWKGQLVLPEEFGKRRTASRKITKRYPCHLLWTTMAVSAEGKVMYCCHDFKHSSNLSGVNDRPLIEIWNEEIREERKRHAENITDRDPCRSCDAWKNMPEYYWDPYRKMRSLVHSLKNIPVYFKRLVKAVVIS